VAVSRINAWARDEDIAGEPTLTVASGGNRIVVAFCTVEHNGAGGNPNTDEIELPDGSTTGQIHPTLKLDDTAFTYSHGETTGYPWTYSNALFVFYLLESDIASLTAGAAFSIEYDFDDASGTNFPASGGDVVKIHYAAYENVDQTDPFSGQGGFEGSDSRIQTQDVPDTNALENEQWLLFCSGDKEDSEFSITNVAPATFASEWTPVSTLNDGSSPATTHEASYVFERNNTDASTDEWDDITVDSTEPTRLGVISLVLQNDDAVSGQDATAELATATFSGLSATATLSTPASLATASFTGLAATAELNSTANLATASFTGLAATSQLSATAGLATATFEGLAATAAQDLLANAELATATFVGLAATPKLNATAGIATATAAGLSATTTQTTTASLATVTFNGLSATPELKAVSGLATSSFVGLEATADIDGLSATAELATAEFVGLSATVTLSSTAGLASTTFVGLAGRTGEILVVGQTTDTLLNTAVINDTFMDKTLSRDSNITITSNEDVFLGA